MIRKIAAIMICVIFLTSCASTESEYSESPSEHVYTHEPEKPVIAKNEGEITVSMRLPRTLNPLLNEDSTVDRVLKLIFEPLITLDEEYRVVPNIISNYYTSADGTSITVRLRTDIRWHDGTPLTSDDLIYSLQALKNEASEQAIYKNRVENITSFTKVDDQTVTINYSELYAGTPYTLDFPIIPRHHFINAPALPIEKIFPPLGNGLYAFKEYAFNKEMILEAMSNSFTKRPYINNINVLITPDIDTDMYSFDQGLIDVVTSDISGWGKYQSKKETNLTDFITNIYEFIGFNMEDENTGIKEFREAIASAINISDMIDAIYLEHAVRVHTPVKPMNWLHANEVKKYEYDLKKAAELLESKGYVNDDTYLYKKQGDYKNEVLLRILVNEENEERVKMAGIIKDSLQQLKIRSEIEIVPFEEYLKRLEERDFEIFLGGFSLSDVPNLSFAFHSSQIQGGQNYFGYKNEMMDSLIIASLNTTSENIFRNTFAEIQKLIAEDIPCISLVFRKSALLTDIKIYGDKKPTHNNLYDNIEDWFVPEQ